MAGTTVLGVGAVVVVLAGGATVLAALSRRFRQRSNERR
jgi:hypothetical protein